MREFRTKKKPHNPTNRSLLSEIEGASREFEFIENRK
jgi:hypothetical protein